MPKIFNLQNLRLTLVRNACRKFFSDDFSNRHKLCVSVLIYFCFVWCSKENCRMFLVSYEFVTCHLMFFTTLKTCFLSMAKMPFCFCYRWERVVGSCFLFTPGMSRQQVARVNFVRRFCEWIDFARKTFRAKLLFCADSDVVHISLVSCAEVTTCENLQKILHSFRLHVASVCWSASLT